jgi:hypothetical protein
MIYSYDSPIYQKIDVAFDILKAKIDKVISL